MKCVLGLFFIITIKAAGCRILIVGENNDFLTSC